MSPDMKSMVESWHERLGKQIDSATKVREKINKAKNPEQAIMLSGKIKAYVDMRCYLESKYGKTMPHLLFKRQGEDVDET